MAIVFHEHQKPSNGIGEGLANLISSGTESYMNQVDEASLQKAISSLPGDATPRQILDTITGTKTYSQAAKQKALTNYIGVEEIQNVRQKAAQAEEQQERRHQESLAVQQAKNTIAQNKEQQQLNKESQERQETKSLASQLKIPEEQKQVLGETASKSAVEGLLKEQIKSGDETNLSPFERKLQDKAAERYITLHEDIPKIQSTLGDINYTRELAKDLGWSGIATSALGLSGKGKELESVSFTLMQPIIKMFNPSGPIAQQKLKMIQEKYAIKGSDYPWVKKAKLDALERFGTQALSRAQQELKFIETHNGHPSQKEMEAFQRESDSMSDVMLDYEINGEPVHIEGLPEASNLKGKTITSPEGKKYYSDDSKWMVR